MIDYDNIIFGAALGGGGGSGPIYASAVNYDNTDSGMVATNVQDAIDELNANKVDIDDYTEIELYTSSDVEAHTAKTDADAITSKAVQTMFIKELPGPIILNIDTDFLTIMGVAGLTGPVPTLWSGEKAYNVGDIVLRQLTNGTSYYTCTTAYTPTPGTTNWNSYSSNFTTAKKVCETISATDCRPYLVAAQNGNVNGAFMTADGTTFMQFYQLGQYQNYIIFVYKWNNNKSICYTFNVLYDATTSEFHHVNLSINTPYTGA